MDMAQKALGSCLVVGISGELAADSANQFKKYMENIIPSHDKVVLDLEKMEFIDSTGLGALVYILQKLNDDGGTLMLACMQPKTRMVFNITKAYKIFDIYDTVDAAVDAMGA